MSAVFRGVSTLFGLVVLLAASWFLLARGDDREAPPALGAEWHTNGPVPCVGDGSLSLSQSGVYLYTDWKRAPLGRAAGRLAGREVELHGTGFDACDSPAVQLTGTWTPTIVELTIRAPDCPVCDGIVVRGIPSP